MRHLEVESCTFLMRYDNLCYILIVMVVVMLLIFLSFDGNLVDLALSFRLFFKLNTGRDLISSANGLFGNLVIYYVFGHPVWNSLGLNKLWW